jgi:hypothetical protein
MNPDVVVYPPVPVDGSTTAGAAILVTVAVVAALLGTVQVWLPAVRARWTGRGDPRPADTDQRLRARMRTLARRDRYAVRGAARWWLAAAWLVTGVAALVLLIVWVPRTLVEPASRLGVAADERGDLDLALQIFENQAENPPEAWPAEYNLGTVQLERALASGDPSSEHFDLYWASAAVDRFEESRWAAGDSADPPTPQERCYLDANARTATILLLEATEAAFERDPDLVVHDTPERLREKLTALDEQTCG